jgi:hypothetical protein
MINRGQASIAALIAFGNKVLGGLIFAATAPSDGTVTVIASGTALFQK